jgi:OOP family OmpA-OmpF porin
MTILESLRNELIGVGLPKLSLALGETEAGTKKAVDAIIPVLLSKILGFSSTQRGAEEVLDILASKSTAVTADSLDAALQAYQESGRKEPGLLAGFIEKVCGGAVQSRATMAALGAVSGASIPTAERLVRIMSPMILGRIRSALPAQTSVASLMNLAANELPQVRRSIPEGFQAVSIAGSSARRATSGEAGEWGQGRWLLPLLGAALVLGGIWLYSRQGSVPEVARQAIPEPQLGEEARAGLAREEQPRNNLITIRLPNGESMRSPIGGFVDLLVKTVGGAGSIGAPLVCDQLRFASGTASLEGSSNVQLDEIAKVLKAYPAVEVKLAGYSDNVGDPDANITLTAERAATVKEALIQRDVAPRRMQIAGYGAGAPIATNDTEEGRQRNHRIEIEVIRR